MMDISDKKSIHTTVWNWVLQLTGLAILIAGAWKIFQSTHELWNGISLAGFGVLVLILGMLTEMKKVSFSISNIMQLTAEMRSATHEARDATKELRELSKIFGAEVLKLLVGGGRFGGHGGSREVYDRSTTLIALFESMGLSEKDIREIQSGIRPWLIIDYCKVISTLAEAKRDSSSNEIWNAFWANYSNTLKRPSPDNLESWLKRNNWIDKKISEWLEDYHYFYDKGQHRRPEIFRGRDDITQPARKQRF
jgi:hypothetical protein